MNDFAASLAHKTQPGTVIALTGELGAGKTTLAKMLARQLGIHDAVTSPTFSLMNVYPRTDNTLFIHADLYRLRTVEDVHAIGLIDYIQEHHHIVLIEWPELICHLLPSDAWQIHLEHVGSGESRIISYSNNF